MDWTLALGSLKLGILDFIVIGGILIGGVTCGALRFSRCACKALGYVVSFPLALLFVHPLSDFILSKMNISPVLVSLISYVILVGVIYVLFGVLGNILSSFFETIGLDFLDSLLGAVWGIAIALVLIFVILEVLSLQTFISFNPLKEASVLYMKVYVKVFPTAQAALKGAIFGAR